MKKKLGGILLVAANLWLGYKFLKEGLEKFEDLEHLAGRSSPFIDFYLAMGETNYMLTLIGLVEIAGAILVLTQVYRLLGSIILLPVALNVSLAHIFLIQSPKGISYTSIWLTIILLNLVLERRRLVPIFKRGRLY